VQATNPEIPNKVNNSTTDTREPCQRKETKGPRTKRGDTDKSNDDDNDGGGGGGDDDDDDDDHGGGGDNGGGCGGMRKRNRPPSRCRCVFARASL
jgi:hypothetical protein